MKDVSVVISTYSIDRLNDVLVCIKSLKKQVLLPREVILVLDPDEALIEFYKSRVTRDVKIVISEDYGLSNARNAGVRVAEGEIIAFIDDDAVADEDWLKNLVGNYDDTFVVGVGGLIKPLWNSGRPTWFPEELDWIVGCSYKGLPERRSVVRNPIGCNMSFLKDVFDKVGYFKADIGRLGKKPIAGEEAEFSIRILERIPRSKIMHDPSAIVYHKVTKERTQLRYVVKRSFYEGFSKALITDSIKPNTLSILSVEESYLKNLLKASISLGLRQFYKLKNVSQVIVLYMSIFFVLTGYFIGMSKK